MSQTTTKALAAVLSCLLLGAGCGSSESSAGDGAPGPGGAGTLAPDAPLDPPEPPAGSALDGTRVPTLDAGETLTCLSIPVSTVVSGSLVHAQGMPSPGRAREALSEHRAPLPTTLRRRDFHNYYQAKGPLGGGPGAAMMVLQARPITVSGTFTGQWNLFAALQTGPSINADPLALLVIVDTSPSMQGVGLGRAKALLKALAAHVRDGDHVAVHTTGPAEAPLLELTVATDADRQTIASAAEALGVEEEGSIADVLGRSYAVAEEKRSAGYQPRLVLVGDGEGDPALLNEAQLSNGALPAERPILVSAFGTGSASVYYSRLFRAATTAGRGKYYYIDSSAEAERLFAEHYDQLWRIAFDDVQLSLTVPGMFAVLQDTEDADSPAAPPGGAGPSPEWLAPDSAMTYLFRLEPCEFGKAPDFANDAVAITFDYLDPNQGMGSIKVSTSLVFEDLKQGSHEQLDKMLAVDAYASALLFPTPFRLQKAHEKLSATPADEDISEIVQLLAAHPYFGG